ncbi:hypothetical protein ACFQ8C_23585 [Streptomyces sp. NPDC056503]|uniref:hypothetical protein n=1 Tax=Streptomyces sp. NPDC056503 TaxID=3345842 RepID=UPI00367FD28A
MRLTVDHADIAAAVGYAARTLSSRPAAPVLAGPLLDATGGERLRVRVFDYGVSADTVASAAVTKPGRAVAPAGHARGSWPADEYATGQRAKGADARVVMDLATDQFLVITDTTAQETAR